MLGTAPDLLRLVAVPALGWAAWRDLRTRRVPNVVWYPLAALGLALLAWEGLGHLPPTDPTDRLYLVRVAFSVGFVVPFSYLFWRLGGFGGADAKALMALALLLPTYPTYYLPGTALPVVSASVGVFSLTVLTNTVVVGLAYPLALAARNALAGHVAPTMFLGRRTAVTDLATAHGRLLESPGGFTRGGLDLDALRMYLRWRGTSLDALREAPAVHRDPRSIGETFDPTDGAVGAGSVAGDAAGGDRADPADPTDPTDPTDPARPADAEESANAATDGGPGGRDPAAPADPSDAAPPGGDGDRHGDGGVEDPWGAAAFLDDIEGTAYGTTPETLREGLEVVADRESVWVSPGIPFLVPMFVGLVVGLTYGDVLVGVLSALGAL